MVFSLAIIAFANEHASDARRSARIPNARRQRARLLCPTIALPNADA
jgi:hypothetical protein